jgi:hypothetical protein
MQKLKAVAAAAVAVFVVSSSAHAQERRNFDNSWFWGFKSGINTFSAPGRGNTSTLDLGIDWFITRSKGGLYVSANQSIFERDLEAFDPTSNTNFRTIRVNDLRRISFAALAFPKHFGGIKVERNFFRAGLSLSDLVDKTSGGGGSITEPQATAGSPRRTETVRRAMPRWYQPRDPVVLVSEARRSYKHGEDGALDPTGKLVCRVTGETVSQVGVNPWANEAGVAKPLRSLVFSAAETSARER